MLLAVAITFGVIAAFLFAVLMVAEGRRNKVEEALENAKYELSCADDLLDRLYLATSFEEVQAILEDDQFGEPCECEDEATDCPNTCVAEDPDESIEDGEFNVGQ